MNDSETEKFWQSSILLNHTRNTFFPSGGIEAGPYRQVEHPMVDAEGVLTDIFIVGRVRD